MGLKGFIFTMDAMIAISLAIVMLTIIGMMGYETLLPEKEYERLDYRADDVMNLLTYLKVNEVKDKLTISKLINQGNLSERDLNRSVLDLIATFWYKNESEVAENISKEILEGLAGDVCLNLTIENETIYSSPCDTKPTNIAVGTRIESGYEPGKPSYGYIARAFLSKIRGKRDSSFVYFGGYVGEGNITRILTLSPFDSIKEAYMELNAGSNFTLYINGNYSGFYVNGSAGGGYMRADKWIVCNETYHPEYCSNFTEGNNTLTFNFTGNNSFIGGGYFRVTYNTTQLAPVTEANSTKYWFPGIHGLINLYSSFYVPGNLTGMHVHLHFKNNYTTFLTIGNVTVLEDSSHEEHVVDVSNSSLASMLDYQNLSQKTVPIRFGTKAFTIKKQPNADVVLITDVSGSMNYRLDSGDTGTTRDCCNGNPCSSIEELVEWMENDSNIIYDPSTKRISLAKCLDKYFVFKIFNASDKNRISLISFSAQPGIRSSTSLTNDSSYLYSVIDNYPDSPSGGTCMCCAINKAYEILNSESSDERKKFVVFMSDGIPSHACKPSSANCHGTSPDNCELENCYGWQECCDCPYFPEATPPNPCGWRCACDCEIKNANYSSCRIHEDLNTTVYSIGFGPVSTCSMGNFTLQAIASCGNGSYHGSTNATELKTIYENISEEIIKLGYAAQKIEIKEGLTMNNTLYPDSYIEFNYTPTIKPEEYGEISLTLETDRFGGDVEIPYKEGWFNISPYVKVVDVKVTSYSSEYWTDRLRINSSETGWKWKSVYWLGDYSNDYSRLGDPYIIQVPANLIGTGNNSIGIGTGGSPSDPEGGSPDSRIIYTIRLKGSVGYGEPNETLQGAIQDARNRLIQKLHGYGISFLPEDIQNETKAIGGIRWLRGPSLLKVIVWKK